MLLKPSTRSKTTHPKNPEAQSAKGAKGRKSSFETWYPPNKLIRIHIDKRHENFRDVVSVRGRIAPQQAVCFCFDFFAAQLSFALAVTSSQRAAL